MTVSKETATIPTLGPIHVLPISAVHPAKTNPRKITTRAVEVVSESLRTFGWQQPLVVTPEGEIIAGHTRYRAAQALGLTEVPVTIAEGLSDEQVRAYRIADNRTSDFTTWDYPLLATQLDELSGDFAEVLALADWQQILNDFDALTDQPLPNTDLDIDPDIGVYAGEKYAVIVVADSEAAIRRVAALCIEMDGVLDVRDRNKPKP